MKKVFAFVSSFLVRWFLVALPHRLIAFHPIFGLSMFPLHGMTGSRFA